jgi:3-hydroxybutyryl-CoA dehydrogenase
MRDIKESVQVKHLGVVGAGTMGTGVAQTFAAAGREVILVDIVHHALELARAQIARSVELMPIVRPAVPRMHPDEVISRIRFTTDLKELRTADFVIENVPERWENKRDIYPEIDKICPPGSLFGVNTSAIPITRIASVTRRPAKVIGTHFMNPAPLKPTVEVIRGYHTSDETVHRTRSLLEDAGKNCIVVRDSPGFVTNRILMVTINEAIFTLHEVISTAADIDRLAKECFGHSMGPLETADLIGLDVVLLSLEVLYASLSDPKYRPCTLLRTMVDAGLLGRKTGQGFHVYESAAAG